MAKPLTTHDLKPPEPRVEPEKKRIPILTNAKPGARLLQTHGLPFLTPEEHAERIRAEIAAAAEAKKRRGPGRPKKGEK